MYNFLFITNEENKIGIVYAIRWFIIFVIVYLDIYSQMWTRYLYSSIVILFACALIEVELNLFLNA